jgi:hypothetical protein
VSLSLSGNGVVTGLDSANSSDLGAELALKADKAAGYQFVDTVYFTANGTFTKATYPWLRAIRVRLVGGGGGGSGAGANPGATSYATGRGGGGGGYGESFITDIAGLSASVTVTVGSGGAGGAAGNNSGSTGGTSSFGALVSATGGGGGVAGATIGDSAASMFLAGPAAGGSTITADLAIVGSPAGPDVHCGGFGFAIGTPSGGSYLAPGRTGVSTSTGTAGTTGAVGGGGGTSAITRGATVAAQAGGAGGAGLVIVDLFA